MMHRLLGRLMGTRKKITVGEFATMDNLKAFIKEKRERDPKWLHGYILTSEMIDPNAKKEDDSEDIDWDGRPGAQ